MKREDEKKLQQILQHLPISERPLWIAEANRLARLIERYQQLKPKRRTNPLTGQKEFVPEVCALCQEARCDEAAILAKEPHRAKAPAPHTLDDWMRAYRREGLNAFLRAVHNSPPAQLDLRRAAISFAAIEWLNSRWREYKSPRHLYQALREQAELYGWTIPSESWLYRQWHNLAKIARAYYVDGGAGYEARYASYVPRDFTDLEALQVLCGDHSERDVWVRLPDGTLKRPWLTVWLDLRTGLLWGWHLSLIPSAQTAALAYANGVETFGAQPIARPDDEFQSYVYTDRGRDYLSHNWDGRVLAVHERAMQLDGGLELICHHRRVGILDDLSLRHLVARGRNPKEKPVERLFKDLTSWEENNFAEFCGRHPIVRPDRCRRLHEQHGRLPLEKRAAESPFTTFEDYRASLARYILRYNSTPHQRSTLGGQSLVPLDEYRRLYTTRYEITPETLALLLMRAEKRRVRKNGVQCFQSHWFYYHEAMAEWKGSDVEVRYAASDYSRVWVLLPNHQLCEAGLVTPTSILRPDKQTLKLVAEARAHERKLIREANLLHASNLRGETVEERVAEQLPPEDRDGEKSAHTNSPAHVHQLTRLDRRKLRQVVNASHITDEQVARIEADFSILQAEEASATVKEFAYEEEASAQAARSGHAAAESHGHS